MEFAYLYGAALYNYFVQLECVSRHGDALHDGLLQQAELRGRWWRVNAPTDDLRDRVGLMTLRGPLPEQVGPTEFLTSVVETREFE